MRYFCVMWVIYNQCKCLKWPKLHSLANAANVNAFTIRFFHTTNVLIQTNDRTHEKWMDNREFFFFLHINTKRNWSCSFRFDSNQNQRFWILFWSSSSLWSHISNAYRVWLRMQMGWSARLVARTKERQR